MPNILTVLEYIWSHPANRGHRFRAIGRAIGWQLSKRLFREPRDIRVFGGLTLRCYPDSPSASLVIYCDESPDYHEMHFMRRYLRPGDAVLDVGANIGVYSLLAASLVGSAGQVLAFEPGPEAHRRLTENLRINHLDNVKVHACALGDRIGVVDFLSQCDTTNRMQTAADNGKSVVSVPVMRLDDVVEMDCALGKMDIEGAEPIALLGAERLLRESTPPVWLLELNGALHAFGFTEATFSDWLSQQGYDLGLYDADRQEFNFSQSRPWELSPNVFAVARDQKQRVAQRCGASLLQA
jgi:FkbM family methyltransferase